MTEFEEWFESNYVDGSEATKIVSLKAWKAATAESENRIAELEDEIAESNAHITELNTILTDTANALKGEPDLLTSHSWHDLADKVTESNKRIAELQSENKQIDEINASLQAHINLLREALENITKTNASTHGTIGMMLTNCIKVANETLASTSAQSLAQHDNEVVERVVTLLKDYAYADGVIEIREDELIQDIRALKGKL